MIKIPLSLFLAGLLWIPGWIQNVRAEEIADDPERNGVRRSQLTGHAVRTVGYWQKGEHFKSRQIVIGPAPPELIDYMHLDNTFQGYSERPVPVSRDSAILRDVEDAMAGLPRAIKRIVERRVFYIALVRDLGGGTGYMDVVAGADGSAAGGFIVLDEGALDRTANAWASWREGSAFRPGDDWSIQVRIEAAENDNRVNAIRYILLHEIGHVVDAVLGVTHIGGGNTQNIADNGFYQLSWTHPPPSKASVMHGDKNRTRFDGTWPERQQLGFYSFNSSAFGFDDVVPVYTWLGESNFPTLYAASSSAEDFAESFVNYVHVVLDGRPYEIWMQNGDRSQFLSGSCWDAPRCADKRAKMKLLVQRAEILQ